MPRLNPVAGFLCRVALVYALLVAPWPGWELAAGAYFRVVAHGVLGGVRDNREVTFEPYPDQPERTRVVIVNPALMNREGAGPVRNVDVDLDRLGLRPLALLLALIFATPVSWTRRFRAALAGVLLLHVCLLAMLGYLLWVESAEVLLVEFTPGGKALATGLKSATFAQVVIALPVLIWMLVTLRREDGLRLWRSIGPVTEAGVAGDVEPGKC